MGAAKIDMMEKQEQSRTSEMIDEILRWSESADAPDDFDTTFVENMGKIIGRGESLSPGQRTAIDNIYERFDVANWSEWSDKSCTED